MSRLSSPHNSSSKVGPPQHYTPHVKVKMLAASPTRTQPMVTPSCARKVLKLEE